MIVERREDRNLVFITRFKRLTGYVPCFRVRIDQHSRHFLKSIFLELLGETALLGSKYDRSQ